ncbi:MAG: cation transporter [Actinobacteria bacterium]|nr:cation transporter [Actinomycetota bacterium]
MIKPEQQPAPVAPTPGPGRPLLSMADEGGCTSCSPAGDAVLLRGSAEWVVLARRARLLSWISLGWLGIEGSVAILAAILAGSVALLGFGIDTAIEALTSIIVVWRFSGDRTLSDTAEAKAQKAVAVSFFLLAPYIAAESIRTLVMERHAETTWLGVALAAVSLLWCPTLGVMKKRLGARLNSAATTGEGRQNLLCAYLAVAVLLGLLANNLFGIWWLDPAVGLLIAGLALKEGRAAWRGETCACC